jgi:phosphoglycerate dehydrogenase-like enzyme
MATHSARRLIKFTGISVSHTPDINIYAVADLTIYLMIGALRQITAPSIAVRKGIWQVPIQNKEVSLTNSI